MFTANILALEVKYCLCGAHVDTKNSRVTMTTKYYLLVLDVKPSTADTRA